MKTFNAFENQTKILRKLRNRAENEEAERCFLNIKRTDDIEKASHNKHNFHKALFKYEKVRSKNFGQD